MGVDIILDFVGAPNFKRNIDSLAIRGKLILIATMGGNMAEDVNLASIMRKHLAIVGTTLRSRPLKYKADLIKSFTDNMLMYFSTGEIQPVIDSIFKLDDIAEAHKRMESNKNIGKIVIEI
jgi:NADPH:quinone reductase-like Zn-dependent oxidoreductase